VSAPLADRRDALDLIEDPVIPQRILAPQAVTAEVIVERLNRRIDKASGA
jgi:hypothetical protein